MKMTRYFLFGAAVIVGLLTRALNAYATEPVADGSPPVPHLRVSAVQMRSTRDLTKNIQKIDEFLARCAKDGSRLVVFPECALTGFFDDTFMQAYSAKQLAGAERQVADACRQHNVYAIIGTACRDGDRLYNSAVIIGRHAETHRVWKSARP
jgi:predicted amidohydrolase